jgi:RNA polymerase primary sigma factor
MIDKTFILTGPPRDQHKTGEQITRWSQYRQRMKKSGLLTFEHEMFLAKLLKYGNEREQDKARAELADHNVRLVSSVAHKYMGRGCDFEDLYAAGMHGLLHAIKLYDHTVACRFSTYATTWIRQSIGRQVELNSRSIRLPGYRISVISHVKDTVRDLTNEAGGERPSDAEVVRYINTHPDRYPKTLQHIFVKMSIEYFRAALADATAYVASTNAIRPESQTALEDVIGYEVDFMGDIIDEHILETLRGMLKSLTEKEAMAVSLRFGLDGQAEELRTYEHIGSIIGISRERARQLINSGVRKMKESRTSKSLYRDIQR